MKTIMPREVIVLAGGLGTRLKSVVPDIPKPMAPVQGKPFLAWLLDYLEKEHMEHIILAVGYRHEMISRYFGDSHGKLRLTYCIEKEPLGTGGGIMQACNFLKGEEAFVLNGDTFFDIRLGRLHHFHAEKRAGLSLALKKMENFDRYGTVETDRDGRITAFHEKQLCKSGLINAGVYCLHTRVFDEDLPEKFSFETRILEREYTGGRLFGKVFRGYFIDIGIPEDYQKAQDAFRGAAFR